MRKTSAVFLAGFVAMCLSFSCKLSYQPRSVQYKDYRLTQTNEQDGALIALIKPYSDSVSKGMNTVVAVSEIELEKKQPEGRLGNVLADGILAMCEKSYAMHVDAAFMNYGGIRLGALPAGNITIGKIYELSPFDDILVLQRLSGKVLQQFLDHIAWKGGWPCAGMSMQIKDRKAINVKIAGVALDESATYTIANVDYVANGGDDCIMLKTIPQINNGYILRNAIIEYFTQVSKQGKKITAGIENRVSNAE